MMSAYKMMKWMKIALILIVLSLYIMTSALCVNDNVHKYKNIEEKINSLGEARVIIVFEPTDSAHQYIQGKSMRSRIVAVDSMASKEAAISEISGFDKKTDLAIINGYAGKLTRKGLEELQNKMQSEGLNVKIYEDKASHLTDVNADVNADVYDINSKYDLSWDESRIELSTGTDSINTNYSWNVLNITGRNITIALLDTGVNYNNLALGGCFGNGTNTSCKVFDGYDFYNNDYDPMDTHTHGTGNAGIISGNGATVAGGTVKGVAPESIIYALKVCDNSGSDPMCWNSDIINAIAWSINHSANIISISLGSYASDDDIAVTGRDPLSLAIDDAVSTGIVVVTSAGNDGQYGESTINSPATSEKTITVGAIYTNLTGNISDDFLWTRSSYGPSAFGRLDPELVAPGADYIRSTASTFAVFVNHGTSLSAPFVSGATALLLEYSRQKNITLTPLQVRALLMQSAGNITGTIFDRGSGELDVQNALSGNIYALVHHTNTYGIVVDNDRWEFVVTPYSTNYANITIFNNNNYNITLNPIIDPISNLENSEVLNASQLKINTTISIGNNSNTTLFVNFTLENFTSIYATTYGGLIILNGSGNNGTANVSKVIRIPVVITVPIYNYGYVQRNMSELLRSFSYCYYSATPKSTSVKLNWSDINDWLWLFSYNSTGDFIVKYNYSSVNTQSISDIDNVSLRWLRVYGYSINPPLIFNMNFTPLMNNNPNITNITDINSLTNSTNPYTLLYYRPSNITINISYIDIDNDIVNVTINDSGFVPIANSSDGSIGYVTFRETYNPNLLRNSSILVTLTDPYGGLLVQNVTILLYTSIIVNSFYPNNNVIYMRTNDSVNVSADARDTGNQTLYYYWLVNNTLNKTVNTSVTQNQSFLFDSTGLAGAWYLIKAFVSNSNVSNVTNETISWNVYLDNAAPSVSIQSPSGYFNNSKFDINYTVDDSTWPSSGTNNCWYNINGTGYTSNGTNYTLNYTINSSVNLCVNASIYLSSGAYTLRVYANDSVGNSGYSTKVFRVNDTTSPMISIGSSTPQGQQPTYVTSVLLTVNTDENATCRFDSSDMDYDSMTGIFSDVITEHTATYIVTNGGYNLYVRCRDMSNNTVNISTQIAFNIPAQSHGGSNGGGSGGGGGGSGGGTSWSDAKLVTKDFDVLIFGENNMSIYSHTIPVSQVSVNMSSDQYGADAKLTVSLDENPLNPINETSFSYMSINLSSSNLSASLEALQGTKIYFTVAQSWLKMNNITKEDVIMLRYNDTSSIWDELPTELLNEDEMNLYYVASSTAFGSFVISHKAALPVVEPVINNTENESDAQRLHSEEGGNLSTRNTISNIESPSIVKDPDNMMWIVWVLSGTFVFIVLTLITVKKMSIRHYENELIKGTEKEMNEIDKFKEKHESKKDSDSNTLSKPSNPFTDKKYDKSKNSKITKKTDKR